MFVRDCMVWLYGFQTHLVLPFLKIWPVVLLCIAFLECSELVINSSPVFGHGDQHDQFLLVYLLNIILRNILKYVSLSLNDQDQLVFCKAEWELIFSHEHLATVSHDSHIVWSLRSEICCTRCTIHKPLVDVYF